MSNQVFENSLTRFSPSVGQSDFFTIKPNVLAVPGISPEYGQEVVKNFNAIGSGIFFQRLNGIDTIATAGVLNYAPAQNSQTKPYWYFTADSSVDTGSTMLRSLTDNVILVNAVVPMNFTPGHGTPITEAPHTLSLCARVRNADGSLYADYGYNGIQDGIYGTVGGFAYTAAVPFNLSCIVRLRAGQALTVVVQCATNSWIASPGGAAVTYTDFLAPVTDVPRNLTKDIVTRCICEFTKLN